MTKTFHTREWVGSAVAPAALAIALIAAVGAAGRRQETPPLATPPANPSLKFRAQEIVKDFGVGYAVAAGDVNGDKKTDILAISGTELVWFEAPTWEKHVILGAGVTTADNVTLAPHDIDGDGRLDIALGAGWTRENTGTLQWVRQNAPGAAKAWDVFPIFAETTLHRIKWADVDGDGDMRPDIVASGRATRNVKIYWNETPKKKT